MLGGITVGIANDTNITTEEIDSLCFEVANPLWMQYDPMNMYTPISIALVYPDICFIVLTLIPLT